MVKSGRIGSPRYDWEWEYADNLARETDEKYHIFLRGVARLSDDELFAYIECYFRDVLGIIKLPAYSEAQDFFHSYRYGRKMGGLAREIMRRYPTMSVEEILTWRSLNQ